MSKRELTDEQRTAQNARAVSRRAKDPEKARAKRRAYYEAHKEECRAYARAYRERNPEKAAQSQKAWIEKHKEQRRSMMRAWWAKNPGLKSEYARKSAYGLAPGQYAAMVSAQNGLCAICRLSGPLVVDHDHVTGKIRGLLCQCCNRAIGLIKESPDRLRAAAQYLETHGGST
jgi:hypothetical protein